jgi:gas vesicle protein
MFGDTREDRGEIFFWMGFAAGALVGTAMTLFILSEKGKALGGRLKDLKEKTLHRQEEEDKKIGLEVSSPDT